MPFSRPEQAHSCFRQLFSASDECSSAIATALEEAYGSFHIQFFEADGSFLGGIDQRGLEKVQATLQGPGF